MQRPTRFLIAGITLLAPATHAQTNPAPKAVQSTDTRNTRAEFAVASIHQSRNSTKVTLTPSPDGYSANQPLAFAIMLAYEPHLNLWSQDSVPLSLPQWARDSYDIEAKISPSDLADWQKQSPENKMLKAMLRSMLEDRCKLVTHWVPAETSGYALVAAKQGPKLKKAVPGEPLPPDGYPIRIDLVEIPGATYYPFRPGDTRTTLPFYNVSMEVLTEWLSESLRTYVVDQTGITGNYDFVLNKRNENEDASPAPDPSAKWDLDSLGLKLVPVKVQTGRLMIDHIEKPSEN